jgi:polyhydroxyalkanoate synthesis regulator protein
MNLVHKNFQPLAKNDLELNVPPTSGQTVHPTTATGLPLQIDALYEEVFRYAEKIRSGYAIPPPPAPPSVGLDYCYPCDDGRKQAYEKDSKAFEEWYKEESEMMSKAMKVLGYLSKQTVTNTARDSTRKQVFMDEMWDAFKVIQERLGKKFLLAWTTYNSDESKLPFLVEKIFSYIRNQQLMGLKSIPNFPNSLEIAAICVERGFEKLKKAKKERDYKVLLNITWIVSLFRSAELLGVDPAKFDQALSDFILNNRFKVEINTRARISNDGTTMAAKLSGENTFVAVPDSNCVLKWTLISPDDTKMKFNLDEAIMKSPEAEASYAGTRNWKTHPANIQLDFCDEKKDTFFLDGFLTDGGDEIWISQGEKITAAIVSSLYSTCFVDVKRLKSMAADRGLQARMQQQMKEKYDQFMAAYQGTDPSKMTPEQIQKMNEAMLAAKDMGNIIQSVSWISVICKDRLINKQKIVFESEVDGKQLNPQTPSIEEAIMKIKIEHVEND